MVLKRSLTMLLHQHGRILDTKGRPVSVDGAVRPIFGLANRACRAENAPAGPGTGPVRSKATSR